MQVVNEGRLVAVDMHARLMLFPGGRLCRSGGEGAGKHTAAQGIHPCAALVEVVWPGYCPATLDEDDVVDPRTQGDLKNAEEDGIDPDHRKEHPGPHRGVGQEHIGEEKRD